MDLLWSSFELTRVIFLLGAALALLYKKKIGITPGGIIVPGSLAIGIYFSWLTPIVVLLTASTCWGLYEAMFRRFAFSLRWANLIVITMSTVIGVAFSALYAPLYELTREAILITLLIPGLMVISFRKYGFLPVITGTSIVTGVVYLVGLVAFFTIPTRYLTELTVSLATYKPLSLSSAGIVFGISLITSFIIYFTFGMRGGGYIVAPFIAVVTFSSLTQSLAIAFAVVLTYLAVKFVSHFTLIVGLERFVFCLFSASIFMTAMDVLASTIKVEGYQTASLILIVAVAVITNDLCLHPLKRSLLLGVLPAQLVAHGTRWIVG